jgi:hypothetical protein
MTKDLKEPPEAGKTPFYTQVSENISFRGRTINLSNSPWKSSKESGRTAREALCN